MARDGQKPSGIGRGKPVRLPRKGPVVACRACYAPLREGEDVVHRGGRCESWARERGLVE